MTDIRVVKIEVEHQSDPELADCLRGWVDKYGDSSVYILRLVELDRGRPTNLPFHGFDPRYAHIEFSFKIGCPSDLDCKPEITCRPERLPEPEINYLVKDYASFRQLILDRLSVIMPDWQERHVPDLGIVLAELLAYAGDYLSYYQDAVATEAYLTSARQRISVRRHVRLVDYQMHEGCNARAWVCLETSQDLLPDDKSNSLKFKDIYFTTDCTEIASLGKTIITRDDLRNIPFSNYEVFEPLLKDPNAEVQLYKAHNEIYFYTWGDRQCCLPHGATKATLRDEWDNLSTAQPGESPKLFVTKDPENKAAARKLRLRAGDILIFEEVIGPGTGNASDANPSHRQAVRLTKVEPGIDRLYDPPVPVLEIEWAAEDALQFPLCLSAILQAPDCSLIENVSIARGNMIPVDHGRSIDPEEELGTVATRATTGECKCEGTSVEMIDLPDKFSPILKESPVTFSQPLSHIASASKILTQDPRRALPQVTLTGLPAVPGDRIDSHDMKWKWHPQYDLLSSQSGDQHFVVEVDNAGHSHLRFGEGEMGRIPDANMMYTALYRVGNGLAGNVGGDTISWLVLRNGTLSGIAIRPRNPLPAQGGIGPEPMAEAKLYAPTVYRKDLQRAVTADDYGFLAGTNPKVQRAAAALRWTGSWYEACVVVDPWGKEEAEQDLLSGVARNLHRYRRMGHDLIAVPAHYVPLDIEMNVCVLPHYLRGHVKAELIDRFSNRLRSNGQYGFFHPDNLTFGEGVSLSTLVAAAQEVPGVQSVTVAMFQRFGEGANHEIENGILQLGPAEIAQLDSDPNFPEHGKLTFNLRGGR